MIVDDMKTNMTICEKDSIPRPQSSPDIASFCTNINQVSNVTRSCNNVSKVDARIVLKVIGKSLEKIATVSGDNISSPFDGSNTPAISVSNYLARLVKYLDSWTHDMNLSKSPHDKGVRALVIALIYIDRFMSVVPDFKLSCRNIHRILAVTMLLATKYMEDRAFSNWYWSKVSGIELGELNMLEGLFCKYIDFDLNISPDQYEQTWKMAVA